MRARVRRAFTLVEMLAVIAIIGILGAMIGVAFSGGGSSTAALGNAQRIVSGIFQAARSHAVMKGVETAVIIYKEQEGGGTKTDSEKYLRFFGIVYRDGATWRPLNRGTYLPKGVYFVPPDGSVFGNIHSSDDSQQDISSLAFPLQVTGAEPNAWYAYRFDARGNLQDGSTYLLFAPATVSGAPNENTGVPALNGGDVLLEEMVGIALRKTGGTYMLDYMNNSVLSGLSSGATETP